MSGLGPPLIERLFSFQCKGRRAEQDGRPFATSDEGEAAGGTQSLRFRQDSTNRPIPRTLAGFIDGRHRSGVVKQYDEMVAISGGTDSRAGNYQCERQSSQALQDQTRGDWQRGDFAAAFGNLSHIVPEEQPSDPPRLEPPAEQMNRDDGRDPQQGQQAERSREDHKGSNTPARASDRATSRGGVPAST